MPLKIVPPRAGKTPYWSIRGTYLGVYVDRSSKTDRQAVAKQQLAEIEREIERGAFAAKRPDIGPTFIAAAVAYMQAGRPRDHLDMLILRFGETPIAEIDQTAIDAAAVALYPNVTPATRNRRVYTPMSAVLRAAGLDIALRRPKGAKGLQRTLFLVPKDAAAIINAAEATDPEFAVLLRFLLYTGCRINEAMALTWDDIDLGERLAYVRKSKNEDPRTMFIRVDLRDEMAPRRPQDGAKRVFPFTRGGGLKDRLTRVKLLACGMVPRKRRKRETAADRRIPPHRLSWVTFHSFRHTWATWMRRYGGLDLQGLVATKNWRDPRSAARYAHVVARDEWAKVDSLPGVDVGVKLVQS